MILDVIEALKNATLQQAIGVLALYFLVEFANRRQTKKMRGVLGLGTDANGKPETLDGKIKLMVQEGFAPATNELTKAIVDLSKTVSKLAHEVEGLRKSAEDHRERISDLEAQVAVLTGLVGGVEALAGLRARMDARRAVKAGSDE